MGKWADLPVELVELIEDCVKVYSDKVRFRALCLYWHLRLAKIVLELPWLLQAVDDNVEASHAIFNPIDKKYYYLDAPNVLQGKICKGSSHGWVITVEDTARYGNGFKKDCNRIHLINPLTSACIELPSRDRFPDITEYNPYKLDDEYSRFATEGDWSLSFPSSSQGMTDCFTHKFAMSSDPSRSNGKDCVIAAIYGQQCRVACCTLINKKWNSLICKGLDDKVKGMFMDIVFHKGKLYALIARGLQRKIMVFGNIHMTVIVKYTRDPVIESNRPFFITLIEDYLVERADGSCLLLVERAFRDIEKDVEGTMFEVVQTLYFKVYEVDPINHGLVELKSIGEDAIILGMNTPIAISSRKLEGYKGNHIYYTDIKHNYNRIHFKLENSEIGVFSLEDGTLEPLCGLKSSSKLGKWSDLQVELVELIEDCIEVYSDKVRFHALCWYWHLELQKIKHEVPWLLQAVDDNVEASHALFDPGDKKYYYLDVPDVLRGKICKGSSHGWVVTVEDTARYGNGFKKDCNRICLINPLTSACIELPSRDKFPDIMKYNPYQVDNEYSRYDTDGDWTSSLLYSSQEIADSWTLKFVMSSDPSRSNAKDCVIAAIYGPESRVACCALKNKKWNTLLGKGLDDKVKGRVRDIIFHKGKLHALIEQGLQRTVMVFENINRIKPNPRKSVIARHTRNYVIERNRPFFVTLIEDYLVERSDGSCLMLVERVFKHIESYVDDFKINVLQTQYFKVYEVDPINGVLVELKSIGEDSIILGMNTPIAISSRNSEGYKGNHIYYTDIKLNYNRITYDLESSEIGVFSLEDGTLEPLCGLKSSSKVIWPPPIWVSRLP